MLRFPIRESGSPESGAAERCLRQARIGVWVAQVSRGDRSTTAQGEGDYYPGGKLSVLQRGLGEDGPDGPPPRREAAVYLMGGRLVCCEVEGLWLDLALGCLDRGPRPQGPYFKVILLQGGRTVRGN